MIWGENPLFSEISIYYQPKQCTFFRGNPSKTTIPFAAWLMPPTNVMTPVSRRVFKCCKVRDNHPSCTRCADSKCFLVVHTRPRQKKENDPNSLLANNNRMGNQDRHPCSISKKIKSVIKCYISHVICLILGLYIQLYP